MYTKIQNLYKTLSHTSHSTENITSPMLYYENTIEPRNNILYPISFATRKPTPFTRPPTRFLFRAILQKSFLFVFSLRGRKCHTETTLISRLARLKTGYYLQYLGNCTWRWWSEVDVVNIAWGDDTIPDFRFLGGNIWGYVQYTHIRKHINTYVYICTIHS